MAVVDYVDADAVAAAVAKRDTVVLLQFSADWCGPCKQMAPMIEEIATAYAGRLSVLKIDVDASKAVAETYNVRGVPNFVLVKDGAECGRLVGSTSRSRFSAFLEDHV